MDIEEISDTQAGQSYGYRLGDPNQEPYVWVSYSGIVGIDSTPHRNRPYPAVTREDGPQVWPEGMGDVIRIMIQERPLPLDTATHFGWDNDLPPHAHEELMMAGRPAPRA